MDDAQRKQAERERREAAGQVRIREHWVTGLVANRMTALVGGDDISPTDISLYLLDDVLTSEEGKRYLRKRNVGHIIREAWRTRRGRDGAE